MPAMSLELFVKEFIPNKVLLSRQAIMNEFLQRNFSEIKFTLTYSNYH